MTTLIAQIVYGFGFGWTYRAVRTDGFNRRDSALFAVCWPLLLLGKVIDRGLK